MGEGVAGSCSQYGPMGKQPSSAPKTTERFIALKRAPRVCGGQPPQTTSRASMKKRMRSSRALSA